MAVENLNIRIRTRVSAKRQASFRLARRITKPQCETQTETRTLTLTQSQPLTLALALTLK